MSEPVQEQTEMVLKEEHLKSNYTNFARVTATPEEVILDFALNPNPFATGHQEIKVDQRIILNFYTAKRLMSAIAATLQRHEGAFGTIELDVRRRVTLPIPDAK